MGSVTLVLGGARSGKSAFALEQANGVAGKKAFIATAEALDDDMRGRILRHKEERGADWVTFEEPLNIAPLLIDTARRYEVVLVDCLTLWVSNLLLREKNVDEEFGALTAALSTPTASAIYLVSNEVGLGVVPENRLARIYRDSLGTLNRRIASTADRVVVLVAGLPLYVKGSA